MRSLRFALALVLAASIGSCDGSTAPGSPLDGRWVAILGGTTELSLLLTATDTIVTGTGVLRSLDSSYLDTSLTVSGRLFTPNVRFTIHRSASFIDFAGVVSGGTLAGTMVSYTTMNRPVFFYRR